MRIKNIKTGKILYVDKCYDMDNNSDYYYVHGTGERIYEDLMEYYYEYIEPDWEKVRTETASRCLANLIDRESYYSYGLSELELVDAAITLSDTLVKKLKETQS
jgi:hypothetical protein